MYKQHSQEIPQIDYEQDADSSQPQGASIFIIIMMGFMYFAQGFILAISVTTPYTYQTLPDYFTLSLFMLSSLPYSLKFLTAPAVQKYSILTYGKRKTWIVTSHLLTTLFLSICALHTDASDAHKFGILCFFLYFSLSLQDISLDALCLKEVKNAKTMSTIQSAFQSSGFIMGRLILSKGISLQFARKIGLQQPITSLRNILLSSGAILFVFTLLIHFIFTETRLATEQKTMESSLWKVYSVYRYYMDCQYRYCRTIVFLIFFNQGINLFQAGYTYELLSKGFSRDTLNTIDNSQNIIITLMIFIFGFKASVLGYKKTILLVKSISLILCLFIWIYFPTNALIIIFTNFFSNLLLQWQFLTITAVCANFPEKGVTGMLYTMNASIGNLGRNKFLHTIMLKKLSWRTAALIGMIIQVPINYFFVPKMMDLIEEGKTQIEVLNDEQRGEQPPAQVNKQQNSKQKQHIK